MDASKIHDKASLLAWLNTLAAEVGEAEAGRIAIWLSARSALRVFPAILATFPTFLPIDPHQSAILNCRSLLISFVAGSWPTSTLADAANSGVLNVTIYSDAAWAAQIAVKSTDTFREVANAVDVAVDEAMSNLGVSQAESWIALELDAAAALTGQLNPPLWPNGFPIEVPAADFAVKQPRDDTTDWSFWIDWYDDIVQGRPQNGPMLTEIALIAPDDWDKGPEVINPMIAEIVTRYRTAATVELFTTTLYDFKFDEMRRMMTAVSLPQDWQTLTDPVRLADFLTDTLDLREDMGDLCLAFEAEGTAMQGAGMARVYLNKVLQEMANAETLGALRVGKLVEWGSMLEAASAREDTQAEFGVMADPFQKAVGKLKDLIRNHFAHTLARFAPLRDIRMEADADPWAVLSELGAIIEGVRTGGEGKLPPLDPADVAVLDDMLDSINRMLREREGTDNSDAKSSWSSEIDFLIAKANATAAVYIEKAKNAGNKSGAAVDDGLKWQKRGTGLAGFVRWVLEQFDKLG